MGCVLSRVDNEERVQNCKERKRAMKQLVGFRKEFANAILAYLKALKDAGITLRQFTESESLELETNLPSSPPLPLPPSPPLPPPIDSPESRKLEGKRNGKEVQEEIIEVGQETNCTPPPPPPPPPSSSYEYWDLLGSSSPQHKSESVLVEDVDDENWAETRSQFEDEDQERGTSDKTSQALRIKSPKVDAGSSLVIGRAENMGSRAMVIWGRRKTLAGIVKELDDYFLKASAGGKEIAVLVDMGTWNSSLPHDLKEKKGNTSARLSSLSWSLSSRSLQVTRDASEVDTPIEPCKPGAHCITLRKIYDEEQTLYTAVKEEEMAKLEHKQKSSSLQKLESDNGDLNKIEKMRSAIEDLQSDIVRQQELVRKTSASIVTIIDEELHPQLVTLLTGLIHMWRTMYECHEFQSRISQLLHNLSSQNTEPSMHNNREAALQLEGGISFWYNSFCRLTKSQRDYVEAMCRWIHLTDRPIDGENQYSCPSMVRTLCEKWQLAIDRLPNKEVAKAIEEFLSVVRSIIEQQEQERNMKKKTDRLERKYQKELKSLIEMEKKLEASGLSPKHTLSAKREKTETFRKLHETEKAKYLNSVELNRARTLSNLQKSLPRVFESLMGFSKACTQVFETAINHAQQVCNSEQVCCNAELSQAEC